MEFKILEKINRFLIIGMKKNKSILIVIEFGEELCTPDDFFGILTRIIYSASVLRD